MRAPSLFLRFSLVALTALNFQGCRPERSGENLVVRGKAVELGQGSVQSYAELRPDGGLAAIGVAVKERSLERLPSSMKLVLEGVGNCSDVDGDGEFDARDECVINHALDVPLPKELERDVHQPVQWVSLTWYPQGHNRPGVYNLAHFDLRLHLMSREASQGIGSGACGMMIACEDFERATMPVPEPYLPEDYVDVGAALPGLGNHLVDSTLPGFGEPIQDLTQAFVYGAYDGHLTFWQVLATHSYLEQKPSECAPIKQPREWEISGFYPTQRCVRWVPGRREYTVTLEGFTYRAAK